MLPGQFKFFQVKSILKNNLPIKNITFYERSFTVIFAKHGMSTGAHIAKIF